MDFSGRLREQASRDFLAPSRTWSQDEALEAGLGVKLLRAACNGWAIEVHPCVNGIFAWEELRVA